MYVPHPPETHGPGETCLSSLPFTSQQCPAPEILGKYKKETRSLATNPQRPEDTPGSVLPHGQQGPWLPRQRAAALPPSPTPRAQLMSEPTGQE